MSTTLRFDGGIIYYTIVEDAKDYEKPGLESPGFSVVAIDYLAMYSLYTMSPRKSATSANQMIISAQVSWLYSTLLLLVERTAALLVIDFLLAATLLAGRALALVGFVGAFAIV